MKYILIGIFMILMLSNNLFANELNQTKIEDFLIKSEQFSKDKDIKEIANLLDETISISIVVDYNGVKQQIKMNKRDYIFLTEEGFKTSKNYEMKVLERKINIKDEIAYVFEYGIEKVVLNGQSIFSMNKVNLEVKLINNEFKIVKMDAEVEMKIR